MPRATSSSTRSSAPGSSGASVTRRTGPASSRRASSSRSGSRRADGGCVPRRRGERNGPSRCAPRMRGPRRAAGTLRSASTRSALGRRDERRQVGGDAGLEQRVARHRVAVGVGAEEVDAREPVHLQVDEAGRRDAAAAGGGEPCGGHATRRRSPGRRGPAGRRRGRPRRRVSRFERGANDAVRRCQPRPRGLHVHVGRAARRSRPSRRRRPRRAPPRPVAGSAPVASRTTRRTRACSFSFVA